MKHCSILLSLMLFVASCSSSQKFDSSTPEGAYKLAEKYEKDERYEEALALYAEVKNKHPYSKYSVEAKLRIAEIQYMRENFIEAQNAYVVFKDLHPKHPKIDYVTYKIGMSYFEQLPSTVDRDLSLAKDAILYFDQVITSYPNSKYVDDSTKRKKEALKRLAKKELYIADFYFVRDFYGSALGRYAGLIETYPDLGLDKKALLGAVLSAKKLKDQDQIKKYYSILIDKYPNSDEAKVATREVVGD